MFWQDFNKSNFLSFVSFLFLLSSLEREDWRVDSVTNFAELSHPQNKSLSLNFKSVCMTNMRVPQKKRKPDQASRKRLCIERELESAVVGASTIVGKKWEIIVHHKFVLIALIKIICCNIIKNVRRLLALSLAQHIQRAGEMARCCCVFIERELNRAKKYNFSLSFSYHARVKYFWMHAMMIAERKEAWKRGRLP